MTSMRDARGWASSSAYDIDQVAEDLDEPVVLRLGVGHE